MELQVGVKVLLENPEGKFLLIKRSPKKYPEAKELWDIVGGRISPGSPLFENLKREVKEEISLDLIEEPRIIAAQDILRIPGRHVVRLTYKGIAEGEPKVDGDDHTEFNWFGKEELKSLAGLDRYAKELLEKNLF